MRKKKIVVINGHPDASGSRFAGALVAAYVRGALAAGHDIRRIDVGELNLAPVRSRDEFEAKPDMKTRALQETIAWADHIVLIYPLWLGGPPAVLKIFLEQVFRYGFALGVDRGRLKGLLKGKTARVIVTMGMPAPIFRFLFDAPGLKAVTRGILLLCGVWPVRSTVIGGVDGSQAARSAQLDRVRRLGAAAV